MADIDYQDLEAKYQVKDTFSLESYVLVDGLPQVPESKAEKLVKVLVKLFSKVAPLANKEVPFNMPLDPSTQQTKGFAFVEFAAPDGAVEAVKNFNRKKLDAKHTLLVDKMSTVAKYISQDAGEYTAPKLPEFRRLPHLRSWLTDPLGRDQAAMHAENGVSVVWMRKDGAPQPALSADPRFTDSYVRWSPLGTYLLSVHQQGVALHAGPDFEVVCRLPQRDVRMVDFSPDEKFLVTGAATPLKAGSGPFKESDEGNSIVVWSIETQTALRTFPLPQAKTPGAPPPWPAFKWSANSQFFARIAQPGTLSIYDSQTCSLVGKKSMAVNGIADFSFAPAAVNGQQVLAFWTPEAQNQTAKVCIVNAATKEIVHNRSLFNVLRVRFFWQSEAQFLCSKIERLTKNKKAMTSSLEIYRMADKSMPIEVLDFKETVLNFAWEPRSDRFAIVSYFEAAPAPQQQPAPIPGLAGGVVASGAAGLAAAAAAAASGPGNMLRMNPMRNVLSFYALERQKKLQGTWKEANRFVDKPGSILKWSPRGRFLAVAIPGSRFAVDFYDVDHEQQIPAGVNSATPAAADLPINVCFLRQGEHIGAETLEWDPSGRYLLTVPGVPAGGAGNRVYVLWDLAGNELRRQSVEGLKALMWRPRPASILPKDVRKRVAKEYKQLAAEFDQQDAMLAAEESEELQRKRNSIITQWTSFRQHIRPLLLANGIVPEEDRLAVRDGKVYLKEITVVEEVEEEL